MPMINMQREPEREEAPGQIEKGAPRYPGGLLLHLGDEELKKLGITVLPEVGSKMHLMAEVFVESTSAYETQMAGKNMGLCLQITDMEIGPSQPAMEPASMLYGEMA